ncbi:type II secretory pathway component [Alteromonas sp. ASW11-19]|uniref:Type II secretory pathway component n=1 Tax=Alteromonas salexigens TaxID=2982530 RepID=A0ABT2VN01_9ALTE|nr:type II secretory pathway component [Alteromonas salexigens]MCU7554686.1 type II secretory pathway component [Alteromonas salexigens]
MATAGNYHPKARQSGSMLVMSLFVIIVLSLLGITLVTMISSASQSVVHDVVGTRAHMAARSGLGHIAATALPIGASPATCNTTINSSASFTNIHGLQLCSYQARCTTTVVDNGGVNYHLYRLESTGQCQTRDGWVSHTVTDSEFVPQ